MQLILAIDADQRQVGLLASLVRGRIAAELIQADSAGEALQALGERVPDLIMTSRLLSPFDEGVLAEYLREMGPSAAHVQTLHIPVFGVAKPAGERSLFSFGRKRKAAPATEGCDPNLFAEEIALYLARAAEERQNLDATERVALDRAPIKEPDDTPLTYVAAYEPDDYVTKPAGDDSSDFAWQPDESPVYETPAAPPAADPRLDLESVVAASMPPEAVADDGVEPFTYRVEEIALGEPEYPDTRQKAPVYTEPAPTWNRSEAFSPDATIRLPDRISYAPEPVIEPQHAVAHVEEERAEEPHDVAQHIEQEQPHEPREVVASAEPSPVSSQPEAISYSEPAWVEERQDPVPVIEHVSMSEGPQAEPHIDLDPPVEEHEAIAYATPEVEEEPPAAAQTSPAVEAVSSTQSAIEAAEEGPAAAVLSPAVEEAIEPPAAPHVTEAEAIAEKHAVENVEAPNATSASRGRQRRSPAFESALALIRKAWKKSDGPATQEPAARQTPAQNEEPALSARPPAVAAELEVPAADSISMAAPGASAPASAEPKSPFRAAGDPMEVDLTCDIDALEDPALMDAQLEVVETPAPDDDVYELSASPALHDLDADIAAAAPPRVVPQSLPETESAPAAKAETQKRTAGKKGAPDQRRKRADKRKAPPQDAKRNNNRPVQDEWGLFDPSRCGFAAVVEKLNEVTEEDPKATQTSVRVISYK